MVVKMKIIYGDDVRNNVYEILEVVTNEVRIFEFDCIGFSECNPTPTPTPTIDILNRIPIVKYWYIDSSIYFDVYNGLSTNEKLNDFMIKDCLTTYLRDYHIDNLDN